MKIDIAQNSESLKISEDVYTRILKVAIGQTSEDLQSLEQAIPIGDFAKIRAITHKLKGDYDNLRLTEMSAVAKEMNENAKTEQDKEKMAELSNTFSAHFVELKEFVENKS